MGKFLVLIVLAALFYMNPASSTEKTGRLVSDLIVLDVRTPFEFNQGHVEGALNLDIYQSNFKDEVQKLDPNKEYAVYCQSGRRSSEAVKIMNSLGFKKVKNLGSLKKALKELNR